MYFWKKIQEIQHFVVSFNDQNTPLMFFFCIIDLKIQAKKAEMQKKTENTRSISKLMQKCKKKGRKCMFNLKIHAKKGKNAFSISKFIQKKSKNKKKRRFRFYNIKVLYPPCIFSHFKPQNSCQKCKKRQLKCFKLQKCIFKKKVENIISKKPAKKRQRCKKRQGVYES